MFVAAIYGMYDKTEELVSTTRLFTDREEIDDHLAHVMKQHEDYNRFEIYKCRKVDNVEAEKKED